MGRSMTKTRATRILVLALLGVALAAPVVAACACLASAPDPTPAASCHAPPATALTVGCCCIESRSGEVDGDRVALPTLRVATAVATPPVADRFETSLVALDPALAPVRGAPPRHTVPLRL